MNACCTGTSGPQADVITRGLSMPHSPRWYAGRLWVCESGAGTLGYIDPRTAVLPDAALAEVPAALRAGERMGERSGGTERTSSSAWRPPVGEPGRRTATGFHPGAATVA